MHSGGTLNGKRKIAGAVGPSELGQSTLKVNPEAPGWIKRVRAESLPKPGWYIGEDDQKCW